MELRLNYIGNCIINITAYKMIKYHNKERTFEFKCDNHNCFWQVKFYVYKVASLNALGHTHCIANNSITFTGLTLSSPQPHYRSKEDNGTNTSDSPCECHPDMWEHLATGPRGTCSRVASRLRSQNTPTKQGHVGIMHPSTLVVECVRQPTVIKILSNYIRLF